MKCLTPYWIDTWKVWDLAERRAVRFTRYLPVPCGRCISCRLRKRLEWTFRISEECKDSLYVAFATLTYDDQHVPTTSHTCIDGSVIEDLPTLDFTDLQLFNDRFKKKLKYRYNVHLRWFCVGEYGSLTNRPHYHCIYFFSAADKREDVLNNVPFFPSVFRSCWDKGSILDFQQLAGDGAAGYCNKYICKCLDHLGFEEDQIKEKSLKSKLIGRGYITRMKAWHLEDPTNRLYAVFKGKKIPLPRSFAYKIFGWTKDKKDWFFIENMYLDQYKREEINILIGKSNGSTYADKMYPFESPPELIEDSNYYYYNVLSKQHDKL